MNQLPGFLHCTDWDTMPRHRKVAKPTPKPAPKRARVGQQPVRRSSRARTQTLVNLSTDAPIMPQPCQPLASTSPPGMPMVPYNVPTSPPGLSSVLHGVPTSPSDMASVPPISVPHVGATDAMVHPSTARPMVNSRAPHEVWQHVDST